MTVSGIKTTARVRTTDGRMGVVVALDGEVAEVMFPEGEEWINVTDLVPAGMGTGSQSCQKCGAGGLHLQPNCVVCRTALTKLS